MNGVDTTAGAMISLICVSAPIQRTARDANDPVRLDVTDLEFNDPVRLDVTDLEFRVDTSPDEVRRFIERDVPGVKVIFSTYQSSRVVSEGIRGRPSDHCTNTGSSPSAAGRATPRRPCDCAG
jgi:hypothetical protein